ncbi:hypothetical protein SASPL_155763 [Salvia splendens]|uniref:Large subunit ribosomal protein L30e n=1 Tax=Salvia splendens TaxID=180675 RepID=A0A8X8YXV7_SALSN|nr:hypothetical protein SASPL_155763 [Salvia splendens]
MSSPYVKIGNRTVDQLKVTELREELKRRRLTSSGLKQDLVKRLDEALRIEMQSLEEAQDEPSQPEVPVEKENAVTDVNDSAKAFTGRDIDIVVTIDDSRGSSGEGKVIETGLVQGTEFAGLEGGQVPEPSFVETTEVEKITEPVKILEESNSQDHGTNEDADATILLNADGSMQEDAKVELSAPNTNEGIQSTEQRENDDSSTLEPGSSVQTLKYQVSAVDPNLGFQVTSDSVSTESVSIIEKNELKIDVINDNVKLELDVKPGTVQQSPNVAVPDGGESHPMDVEEPLDKNNVKDGLDIKDVKEPLDKNDDKVDLDIKDVEELHDVKSIDSGDADPPEKLSLDRSSGDDSMEEDIMESKQMDGKSDSFTENVENSGTPSVKEEDHVDVVGHDKPVEMETASGPTSVKRKFQDKEAVGNHDAEKKVRRWNTEGLKSANSLANVEEAPKERVVPPSSKPPTNSLRIDHFLRPFTLKAVQELLGKTGTVTSFWMDHIKTHCFVSYSSVEEALETRNAVYNLQWPTNGGRLLVAEFVDPQEVKSRVEAPLASPAAPSPTTGTAASTKGTACPGKGQAEPPTSTPLPAAEKVVDPPIVTLDDLFRKTKAPPRIYYLPLSDEVVASKLKTPGKNVTQSAGDKCRMFRCWFSHGSHLRLIPTKELGRFSRIRVSHSSPPLALQQTPATMVAAKKTKKTHESINNRLALVMKSGKYTLGYKTVLKTLRNSKGKLILISNNCPPLRKSEIEYYAMLAKIGVHHYNGNNVDLGTACGKYFRVSCLSIVDPGDSDIIKSLPEVYFKAELVVTTWDRQFHSSEIAQKVPLLYLANDILQNSKRKGNEFVTEFWKVLPSALKELESKGDDRGKNVVSRLVGIWEERRVFGSQAKSLRDAMLGEELPPPLELRKKRSRSVRIVKKDSRSIKTKLSIGGTAEKIVSAFHSVFSEHNSEDEELSKCKSAVHRVKRMEKDVDVALTKAKDPSRKALAKELEEEESTLNQCIEKLKEVENNRAALVAQLRDALHEQESELENVRTQMQVAQAQVEEATHMRKQLNEDRVFDSKPSTTPTDANPNSEQSSKKSAAAIAAEVADRLAASTSSQYIMSSVLSSFAAEAAKGAGLTPSSTSTTSFSSSQSKSENPPVSDPKAYMAAQINPSQNPYPTVMAQPSMQVPNSQALYHSVPNQPSMQYMQPGSYDYSGLSPMPPGPPPSYMVNPMVQMLPMGHQPSTVPQQQPMSVSQQQPPPPAGFRPLAPTQAPGMFPFWHSAVDGQSSLSYVGPNSPGYNCNHVDPKGSNLHFGIELVVRRAKNLSKEGQS